METFKVVVIFLLWKVFKQSEGAHLLEVSISVLSRESLNLMPVFH